MTKGKEQEKLKTREEIISEFKNEHIDLIAMTIEVEGSDEPLEYSQEMEDMPQHLHFLLPEYSIYHLTIKFKIVTRPIKELTYHQVVKKSGFPFKTRKEKITDVAIVNDDSNPYHTITFPPDGIPGGAFIRGKYDATSTFYEGEEAIFTTNWGIEVTKKGSIPQIGR